MNKKAIYYTGLIFLLVVFLFACATGKKHYDFGIQLRSAGKYKDAIAYLKQAIAKEPNNKIYQQALADIQENQINKFVNQGIQTLGSSPFTIATVNMAKDSLANASEIDPHHTAVKDLATRLEKQNNALVAEVENLYFQAKDYIAAEEWLKANFTLQQIQNLFPYYEDSFQLLTKSVDNGSQAFHKHAEALFDNDNIRDSLEYLRKALSLKPDYKPSRELLNLALERDNKDYFIEEGKKAVLAQQWNRAVKSYDQAIRYDPENKKLKDILANVRTKTGLFYVTKAIAQMNEGWLLKAFESYDLALKYMLDSKDFQINSLCKDLCSKAAAMAENFNEQNRFGAAWFWYEKIKNIDAKYPRIFFLAQIPEDRIKERVRKSIAVFDFNSPSDNRDAGVVVANNLITFLFNNASGDIKILERENLKSILEEMKLGQIGVVSGNTAKQMGSVYGIDIAIMGSVLLYKVDSIISDGIKSVRYEIGTKIEDNIEYLNWKAKYPEPNASELAQAPPAKITIPEFAEKDYKVSNHKKVGFVQLSFRIVDVATGENIKVKTIERKKTVEDETSAGLPCAKVNFDPLEIITDTELLQQMTDEVVTELGMEMLKPLSNLEKTYFQSGENFMRRREILNAVECFIDAVFDEKLKRIQGGSPMTQKALISLEEIFRNYNVN